MMIQIILVIVLIGLIVFFLRSRKASRTKALKKIALVLFVVLGVIAVIFPDTITTLAHFVGVGRGADLLLYGLTVVVIFKLLNDYTKDMQEEKRLVKLARKVAILEAQERYKNN